MSNLKYEVADALGPHADDAEDGLSKAGQLALPQIEGALAEWWPELTEQIIKFIMLDEPKNEADKESVRDIKERLPEHLEPTIMALIKKCLPAMEANVAELV